MKTIKIYCTAAEKERIQSIAEAEDLTTSKYLLSRGLSDLRERATLIELIGCMVRLLDTATVRDRVRGDLLNIAQAVAEGRSISEARAQVAEVCKDADQGNQRP